MKRKEREDFEKSVQDRIVEEWKELKQSNSEILSKISDEVKFGEGYEKVVEENDYSHGLGELIPALFIEDDLNL